MASVTFSITFVAIVQLAGFTPIASAREFSGIQTESDLIQDFIEARIKRLLAENLADEISNSIENHVAKSIDDVITDNIQSAVEEKVDILSANALGETLNSFQRPEIVDPSVPDRTTPTVEARLKPTDLPAIIEIDISERLTSRSDFVADKLDVALESVANRQHHSNMTEEWLVLTDRSSLIELELEGYIINNVEVLDGLGYVLGTISAPASFDPTQLSLAAIEVVNSPTLAIDLNHVYMPQRDTSAAVTTQRTVRATPTASTKTNNWPLIGMIDSRINQAHSVFKGAKISEQIFTPKGYKQTTEHGTAIASILIGNSEELEGFAPGAQLFNGAVFSVNEDGIEFSTTAAVIRAVNWLAKQKVKLLNMSLAGPDNAILARVIESACQQGITIVTSVGNAGPSAPPLYPAAYECTIAVTAVNESGLIYHRANRGAHVDFAVPGIHIAHALGTTDYSTSNGTSYAAAVLTGLIATTSSYNELSPAEIKFQLSQIAEDRGVVGLDPIYGHGLILPTRRSLASLR